jgi:hypothetical protein
VTAERPQLSSAGGFGFSQPCAYDRNFGSHRLLRCLNGSLVAGGLSMDSITNVMPLNSTVEKAGIRDRLIVVGYLSAITLATIGWVSAFGWMTLKALEWLLI